MSKPVDKLTRADLEAIATAAFDAYVFLGETKEWEIRTLEREKEHQIASQNFDAAMELRDQIKELRRTWSRDAVRDRLRDALTQAGLVD